MIPLNMTSRQQTLTAELLVSVRSFAYKYITGEYRGNPTDQAILIDSIQDWILRFQVRPTELDTIFDKMHRSGANN